MRAHLLQNVCPHVVITGSLNTLQHSWQHSFTEGCSANTSGSGSSSSSGSENVERRDMLDSECRERTEMAESERRGVLMGGMLSSSSRGE